MNARLLTVWLCLLTVCSGCQSELRPATQLIVIVNSDLTPVSELSRVVVSVEGVASRSYTIGTEQTVNKTVVPIPFSFGVKPPAGNESGTVLIQAEALAVDGQRLVSTAARVGFVRGATRVLTLQLVRSCKTVLESCGADETCRETSCVPIDVDVTSLPPARPRDELVGLGPLAPTCIGACVDPSAARAVDAAVDASATDASADAGPPRECRRAANSFDDLGRDLTRSLDNHLCPVAAHSEEFGLPEQTAAENLAQAAAFVRRAVEVSADILSFNIALLDDELLISAYPNVMPKRREALPTLVQLLEQPELVAADQMLRLTISEPVPDEAPLAQRLLSVLVAHRDVIRPCRPLQLWSESVGPGFHALLRLRELMQQDVAHADLLALTHFGVRMYGPPSEYRVDLDEVAAAGFDTVSFERRIPDLLPALSYARRLGLATNIAIMYDPHMAANLCGLSSSLESLIKVTRPEGNLYVDELHRHIEGSLSLVDLDLREVMPGSTELSYRGLPAWALAKVALGDGSGNLPALLTSQAPPESLQSGDGPSLHFDESKGQSLALHNAINGAANAADVDNPYPRLTVSAVVRFGKVVLAPGERQVIVSKRRDTTGWALELVNEGAGTMLRFVHFATGLHDNVLRRSDAVVMTDLLGLNTSDSYYLYAHFTGAQITLIVGGQEWNEHFVSEPAMNHVPRFNDAPVTLGADPGASSGFFDGDIQLVRVVSTL